jgi:hypothetical protein
MQSPLLQLLGLSTSKDVTSNHLSNKQSEQHLGFGCQQGIYTRHCVQATALQGVHQGNHLTLVQFDSNLYLMGVDGHASYCIANFTDQFDGNLKLYIPSKEPQGMMNP